MFSLKTCKLAGFISLSFLCFLLTNLVIVAPGTTYSSIEDVATHMKLFLVQQMQVAGSLM